MEDIKWRYEVQKILQKKTEVIIIANRIHFLLPKIKKEIWWSLQSTVCTHAVLEELEKSYLIFPSWQISGVCRQKILVASLEEFGNFELLEKKQNKKLKVVCWKVSSKNIEYKNGSQHDDMPFIQQTCNSKLVW